MNILDPVTKILQLYFDKKDSNLKLLISGYLENYSGNDKNEITRITYGIARKERLLKHIAEKYSKKGLIKTDMRTLILLYIGIYMLVFSDSYPAYAVVNEIANSSSKHSKRFLNAVLRKIGENTATIKLTIEDIKDLRIRYSVSDEIAKEVKTRFFSAEDTLKYLDSEPVFHIKADLNLIEIGEMEKIFSANGVSAKWLKEIDSFEVVNAGKIVQKIIRTHPIYFQNSGSFAISAVTASLAKSGVYDCCAAPGTKSITLSLMRPDITIVSGDVNFRRIRLIQPIIKKFNISNIDVVVNDILSPSFCNTFDTILIDAPCTSAGTLRKNPDLKIKITKQKVKKNSTIQKRILSSVISMAGPDTTIIYSVCSFFRDETESVMKEIFNKMGESKFKIIDIRKILSKYKFGIKQGKFGTYLIPDKNLNNDLFYISAFKLK